MSSSTYRTVLRTPGAAVFFTTAAVGRVGIAMTSLGLVWLVHARTGSYTVAGIVTGSFAVAEAVAGPQVARLIDRLGQTRVLPPLLLAHAAAVAALLGLVTAAGPVWSLAVGGVLAGATIPQLGALSAARWSRLLHDDTASALPTAFSLESLSVLPGVTEQRHGVPDRPVLVSAVAATGHPALGTVLAAALTVAGGLALAAQHRTAPTPHRPSPRPAPHRPIPARAHLIVLVGVNLGIGAYFGAIQVSVTAFAVQNGAPGTAAPLYAVSSGAGLLAGWLYGLRRWRRPPTTQLVLATTGLTIACLTLLTARSPLNVAAGLAATGLAVPPILVLCSVLTQRSVHPTVLTQGFTWLNSAGAAGTAATVAISGRIIDTHGSHGGFTIATTAATAIALLAASHLLTTRRQT